MRLSVILLVSFLCLVACSPSSEELRARKEAFEFCMNQAKNVKESNFALFNKGDDLIYACEDYSLRNS